MGGAVGRQLDRGAVGLLSAGHFSVDLCQGVVPAMLPFFLRERHLTYAAAAGLVLAQTISSSVLQPLFGELTDRRPAAWLMPAGVAVAAAGLAAGTLLPTYGLIWLAIAVSGVGIAAYHPEGARYTNYASGDRRATGMSFFSLGGNGGFACAPILATPVLLLLGVHGGWIVAVVPLAIATAMAVQLRRIDRHRSAALAPQAAEMPQSPNQWGPFTRLTGVLLSRSVMFYGLNTFIPLYWIAVLRQPAAAGGLALSTLLVAGGIGTLLGGRLADRFDRRRVVIVAIALIGPLIVVLFLQSSPLLANVALAPLALAMYAPSGILVLLGQEYLPSRVGTASGVTLGLAVSAGGMVTPALGFVADRIGLHAALWLLVGVAILAFLLAVTLPKPSGQA